MPNSKRQYGICERWQEVFSIKPLRNSYPMNNFVIDFSGKGRGAWQ